MQHWRKTVTTWRECSEAFLKGFSISEISLWEGEAPAEPKAREGEAPAEPKPSANREMGR